jgi:hypothetical protein
VDEFADDAFKVAPGIRWGSAAGILLCAGTVVALKRQPARQAGISRRHRS